MEKIQPIKGQVYSLRNVIQDLELLDSPHLCFISKREQGEVIQTSHLTEEELLSVPGFAETQWRYLYTTYEWIPIFRYVGRVEELPQYIDWESDIDNPGHLWVTPKGFPREQYVWKEN